MLGRHTSRAFQTHPGLLLLFFFVTFFCGFSFSTCSSFYFFKVTEDATEDKSHAELEEEIEAKEAKSRAVVLEMLGDLPDAEAR